MKVLDPIAPGEILLDEFCCLGSARHGLRKRHRRAGQSRGRNRGRQAGDHCDTALRTGNLFGTDPKMWLNLRASYELRLAEHSYWPEARARIRAR